MEIGKINAAIERSGYNPFGVSGTSDQDAQKLAEKNGISVEEAKNILQEAEKTAQENDKMSAQQSAMLEMLNTQDEEELVVIDDADFDNFLNQQEPEQQMQNLLNKNQFATQNDLSQNAQTGGQSMFGQDNNPFLKMKL